MATTATTRGKKDFDGNIDGEGYKRSMDDPINKPELTQVPPPFIAGVARVLQHGAKKYSKGNWMRGMSWSSVIDAMKRHIAAIEMGEDVDSDSGLPHIDHLACGAAFLSWYQNGPDRLSHQKFDDRLYKPKKAALAGPETGEGYIDGPSKPKPMQGVNWPNTVLPALSSAGSSAPTTETPK